MDVKEQPGKAPSPMVVRPAGSSMDVKEEQSQKALSDGGEPAGSSMDVKEEQLQKLTPLTPASARSKGRHLSSLFLQSRHA